MLSPRHATRWAGVGLLVAAAAFFLAGCSPRRAPVNLPGYGTSADRNPTGSSSLIPTRKAFSIFGNATGLYPGATLSVVLTVTNPQPFALEVTSITTTVGNASPVCPSSYLNVSSFNGPLHVAARGHASTTVHASMAHSAPDACEGAVFPLQYTGQGQRA